MLLIIYIVHMFVLSEKYKSARFGIILVIPLSWKHLKFASIWSTIRLPDASINTTTVNKTPFRSSRKPTLYRSWPTLYRSLMSVVCRQVKQETPFINYCVISAMLFVVVIEPVLLRHNEHALI